MKYKEFVVAVAKNADTSKTSISVAEVSRVLSEAFKVLAKTDAATSASVIASGLALAKKKIK